MLADLRDGQRDAVIVYHVDRFTCRISGKVEVSAIDYRRSCVPAQGAA